jgi:outer membrane biosynthesis protein TonB
MRYRRTILTALPLALGLTLGGCESFDPTDWFNTKKPLPGDRRDVFPGGVPGVAQGVPPELIQGGAPSPEPPPQVVEEKPKPKAKPKPKPKPQQAAAPPPPPSARTTAGAPQPRTGNSSAWPEPQQTAGQPAPAQGAAAPFPDPPRR